MNELFSETLTCSLSLGVADQLHHRHRRHHSRRIVCARSEVISVHFAMGLVATILTCLIYRVLLNAPAVGAMLLANLGAFSASDQEICRSHRLSERVLAWVNGEVESSIATARPQSRFAFKD